MNKEGIEHELTFWKRFVTEERFQNNWLPNKRNPELPDLVFNFISGLDNPLVLDVGSGPVSILHGSVDNLITSDPLSPNYQRILDYDELGINPPCDCEAENLPGEWKGKFDVVHCSNALDHVSSPEVAYESLLSCVKPGGYLIIQGFTNEGKFENYQGFHQWNLDLSSILNRHSLICRDKEMNLVFHRHNYKIASKEYLPNGREWMIWVVRKDV